MKNVDDYQKEIQEAQEGIRKIQEVCVHMNFFTGMYSWRPGAMQPSRICSGCHLPLGGISQEEYDKVMYDTYKDLDLDMPPKDPGLPPEDSDCS